jgi:hypothetical protein
VSAAGQVLNSTAANVWGATATPTLGVAGATRGTLTMAGNTSGSQVWQPATAASGTITWPAGTVDFSSTGGASNFVRQNSAGSIFTVVQPATTDLSDVSTGSWTPTVAGTTITGSCTYTVQVGSYEKIGRVVFARFAILTSACGTTPTGNLTVAGFPFANNSTASDNGYCTMPLISGWTGAAGYTMVGAFLGVSATVANIEESGSGKTVQATATTEYNFGTLILEGFCTYHT